MNLCERSHGLNRKRPHPKAVGYFQFKTRGGTVAGQWLCAACRKNLDREWVDKNESLNQ